MKLTKKEIKRIELVSIELKKWADNLSYKLPSPTKVTLTPSSRWRYKKEILFLCAKTKMGSKVEKVFAELDKLHQEYESWRAKTLTEDNEENFRTLVDCLKDTLWDLADTLNQIAQISREELSSEKPAETGQKVRSSFKKIIGWIFKKTSHFICAIFIAVIATIIAAIIVDILADFGWFERIKSFFTR